MNESRKIIALARRILLGMPIILICILAAVLIARKALNYTTPQYEAVARIKLDESGNGVSGANLFKDFDVFSVTSKIAAEVELLRSEAILEKVATKLEKAHSIFRVGKIRETELGQLRPFEIGHVAAEDQWVDRDIHLKIGPDGTYQFNATVQGQAMNASGNMGDSLHFPGLTLLLERSTATTVSGQKLDLDGHFRLRLHSPRKQIAALQDGGLDIKASDEEIPIIRIAFRHASPERAALVANAVAEAYIEDHIAFKTQAAGMTLRFIDKQISDVGSSLNASESALETYRDRENVVNTRQETETNLRKIAQMKIQLTNMKMREQAMDSLDQYINAGNRRFQDLAPSFETFGDLLFTELLKKIKSYEAERIDLLVNYTKESRAVVAIDAKIAETVAYIKESIGNARKDMSQKRESIASAIEEAETDFDGLPARDRQMVILDRDFQLNQKLYLFLMEKRMESAIQENAAMSFHRIIERAQVPEVPVSPTSSFVSIVAGFLGLLLGIGLIVAREFFAQRLQGIDGIEKRSTFPILAAVAVPMKDRKAAAIAANELAARLLARRDAADIRSLALASQGQQEEPSLLAQELAASLAAMGRKVALIELDPALGVEENGFANALQSGKQPKPEILANQLHRYHCGSMATPAATLLNHPSYAAWWSKLESQYELVIANAGACGDSAETLSILASSDLILWISRSEASPLDAVTLPDQLNAGYGIGPFLHVLNTSPPPTGIKAKIKKVLQGLARLQVALSSVSRKEAIQG